MHPQPSGSWEEGLAPPPPEEILSLSERSEGVAAASSEQLLTALIGPDETAAAGAGGGGAAAPPVATRAAAGGLEWPAEVLRAGASDRDDSGGESPPVRTLGLKGSARSKLRRSVSPVPDLEGDGAEADDDDITVADDVAAPPPLEIAPLPTPSTAELGAASTMQRHARGKGARARAFFMREAATRQQWIDYYLSQHKLLLARRMGWAPPAEHAAAVTVQKHWRCRETRRAVATITARQLARAAALRRDQNCAGSAAKLLPALLASFAKPPGASREAETSQLLQAMEAMEAYVTLWPGQRAPTTPAAAAPSAAAQPRGTIGRAGLDGGAVDGSLGWGRTELDYALLSLHQSVDAPLAGALPSGGARGNKVSTADAARYEMRLQRLQSSMSSKALDALAGLGPLSGRASPRDPEPDSPAYRVSSPRGGARVAAR